MYGILRTLKSVPRPEFAENWMGKRTAAFGRRTEMRQHFVSRQVERHLGNNSAGVCLRLQEYGINPLVSSIAVYLETTAHKNVAHLGRIRVIVHSALERPVLEWFRVKQKGHIMP